MLIIIGVLFSILGIIIVFFNISYSKTRTEFKAVTGTLLNKMADESDVFTEDDIANLPVPVRKYFRYCGYIGKPKMSYMKVVYEDVDFSFGRDKANVVMDYTQYNFAKEPIQIAYIDSSMYGIPFEGLDSYIDGKGSMKGVVAKCFTLFDQDGEVLNKASLVTYLAECLMIPSAALQDYIVWEEIDDLHAGARIDYYGITASGIFTFKENGEMLSFTTDDREATATDGTSEKIRWSTVCSDYAEINTIKKPTKFQAIWHYDDGDLIYFDGKNAIIEYDTAEM